MKRLKLQELLQGRGLAGGSRSCGAWEEGDGSVSEKEKIVEMPLAGGHGADQSWGQERALGGKESRKTCKQSEAKALVWLGWVGLRQDTPF